MPALLYLPCGAVSEEGGSVGRGRHQGGGAARGLAAPPGKKGPRLPGSGAQGHLVRAHFMRQLLPRPHHPPTRVTCPRLPTTSNGALTSRQGCKPSIRESGWLKELSLGCAGILSPYAPLHTGPSSTLWGHPEQPVTLLPNGSLETWRR